MGSYNSTARKFPIHLLPVELRVKIYEYVDTWWILPCNMRDADIAWLRTILLSAILNDMEALELAAIQGYEQRKIMCELIAYPWKPSSIEVGSCRQG